MLSAWDVYWVMQLDSIGIGARILAIAAVGSTIGSMIVGAMVGETWADPGTPRYEDAKASRARFFKFARRMVVPAIFVLLGSFLVPSTKTAAAMIVLPAIANNQTLRREAGELYVLAKDALRSAIKPEATASDPAK